MGYPSYEKSGWLKEASVRVFKWATRKGWEPAPGRTFGDECALIHSEVSEALEAYQLWGVDDATKSKCHPLNTLDTLIACENTAGNPDHICKPEGVGSEFADILVRLLHYCEARGINLEWEFERKMRYNESRPYRHGGKLL